MLILNENIYRFLWVLVIIISISLFYLICRNILTIKKYSDGSGRISEIQTARTALQVLYFIEAVIALIVLFILITR